MIDKKPSVTIGILARYFCQVKGYKKQRIITELNTFMEENYNGYRSDGWYPILEKYANNAEKYKLIECDGVWITENELSLIESLHNKVLERLCFTLLCLAKFGNFKNPDNNNWVSETGSEIYRLANISASAFDKEVKINRLRELGLVAYAKRVDNLKLQVLYVDDNSNNKLFIKDFRALGTEYLLYKGESCLHCADCGLLVKRRSNRQKYCKECSDKIQLKRQRESMSKLRSIS